MNRPCKVRENAIKFHVQRNCPRALQHFTLITCGSGNISYRYNMNNVPLYRKTCHLNVSLCQNNRAPYNETFRFLYYYFKYISGEFLTTAKTTFMIALEDSGMPQLNGALLLRDKNGHLNRQDTHCLFCDKSACCGETR